MCCVGGRPENSLNEALPMCLTSSCSRLSQQSRHLRCHFSSTVTGTCQRNPLRWRFLMHHLNSLRRRCRSFINEVLDSSSKHPTWHEPVPPAGQAASPHQC